jgi:hypothetical protein
MGQPPVKESAVSLTQSSSNTTAGVGLPGAAVIAQIRRVVIIAVIAALVYLMESLILAQDERWRRA